MTLIRPARIFADVAWMIEQDVRALEWERADIREPAQRVTWQIESEDEERVGGGFALLGALARSGGDRALNPLRPERTFADVASLIEQDVRRVERDRGDEEEPARYMTWEIEDGGGEVVGWGDALLTVLEVSLGSYPDQPALDVARRHVRAYMKEQSGDPTWLRHVEDNRRRWIADAVANPQSHWCPHCA